MSIAAPPNTSIDASRGVVTFGNLTLAFHLAPDDTEAGALWTEASSRGQMPDEAAAEELLAAAQQLLAASSAGAAQPRASSVQGQSAARRLAEEEMGGERGAHLFTVGISGEIVASRLQLEPDVPDRPASYRLGITMELDLDSLRTQVGFCTPLSDHLLPSNEGRVSSSSTAGFRLLTCIVVLMRLIMHIATDTCVNCFGDVMQSTLVT